MGGSYHAVVPDSLGHHLLVEGHIGGLALDQQLMEGMVMFNIAVEDPSATDIECSDDKDVGYVPLSRRR